jgi:serine-aspartate repeat-containing protein C/D/E
MTDESTEAVERDDDQEASSGADAEEGKEQQREERDPPAGQSGDDDGDEEKGEESQKAQEKEEERESAAEKIRELEQEGPPADLEDWPDDAAKYETFGGPEGEHGYHEGPEEEHLGPSSLRHLEGGGVRIAGEDVDDADQFKSDPIPGGPTDPDAKQDLTAKKIREEQGRGEAAKESGDDDDDDSDSDSDSDSDNGDGDEQS